MGIMRMEQTFEDRMCTFIASKLAKGETLKRELRFGKEKGYYRADAYLPEGCATLHLAPRSIVEFKGKLQPDTLYMLYGMFKSFVKDWGVDNFIVIYEDQYLFSDQLLDVYKQYKADHFFVYSANEIINGEKEPEPQAPKLEEWKHKRARILMDAQYDFSLGHNTFFFGAGLGVDVNMPTWNELLGDLMNKAQQTSHSAIGYADYQNIDNSCNHSALIIGRYIESGFPSMNAFVAQMHASLYKNDPKPDSALYKAIVKAIKTGKVEQVITFNYDDLVETALMNENIPVHSVFDRSHFSGDELPVYHVHGMIPQSRPIASTPVLSEKEYHTLYKESFYWSNVVQLQAFSRTTCFFVGLSMNDPNLRRLLDISRNGIDALNKDASVGRPCHYAILERKSLAPAHPDPAKDLEHFTMQERMMEDLGINVIWFEQGKFEEIAQIVRRLY